MNDLTYKEYAEMIENLSINLHTKNNLLFNASPKTRFDDTSTPLKSYEDKFIFDISRYPNFIVENLYEEVKNEVLPFFKYKKWKTAFYTYFKNRVERLSGTPKNKIVYSIYWIITNSEYIDLKNKDDRDFLIDIFTSASNLINKNEEESLIYILCDIFKNKESDEDLVKELFAIYLENVTTNPKYQKKINTIKEWAKDKDFSILAKKYKNIRNFFDNSNEEKVFYASSKKYDLGIIAKTTRTKLSVINSNFLYLNEFIDEKLKGNDNIQNFIVIDEKIHHKVLIVYENRDFFIDAAINMHEAFFNQLRESEKVETDLISSIWDKLTLKSQIETEFQSKGLQKTNKNPAKPRKI